MYSSEQGPNIKRQKLAWFVFGIITMLFAEGILLLGAVQLGLLPTEADRTTPGQVERFIASTALHRRVRHNARLLSPTVSATDKTLLEGMRNYRDDCAGCHGDFGAKSDWGSKHFYPRVPQFAEDPPQLTEREIYYIIKHGIRYSGMGGWDGQIRDETVWSIAMFLSRLRDLPPAVSLEWRSKNKSIP